METSLSLGRIFRSALISIAQSWRAARGAAVSRRQEGLCYIIGRVARRRLAVGRGNPACKSGEQAAAENGRPAVRCESSVFSVPGRTSHYADSVPSLPALGPWAPPTERGPSLESIHRVSLTVDLCEG